MVEIEMVYCCCCWWWWWWWWWWCWWWFPRKHLEVAIHVGTATGQHGICPRRSWPTGRNLSRFRRCTAETWATYLAGGCEKDYASEHIDKITSNCSHPAILNHMCCSSRSEAPFAATRIITLRYETAVPRSICNFNKNSTNDTTTSTTMKT